MSFLAISNIDVMNLIDSITNQIFVQAFLPYLCYSQRWKDYLLTSKWDIRLKKDGHSTVDL